MESAMKFILAATLSFVAGAASAQELIVGTLNTESSADTSVFAVSQTIQRTEFVDIWALQEVQSLDALTEYTVAAGAAPGRKSFRRVVSESGENNAQHRKHDLLGMVYNSSRLRHVETVELHAIRSVPGPGRLGESDWRLRGALFLRFQDRDTGAEFCVGNVHLKCCGGDGLTTRAHQAELLKDWIERTDVPVILTGDFNIPVDPDSATGSSSAAFQTLSSVMDWVCPANPIKTQCSPNFNSMLDHVFVKEGPNLEAIDVRILETDPSFCAADATGGPDHRPILARFQIR